VKKFKFGATLAACLAVVSLTVVAVGSPGGASGLSKAHVSKAKSTAISKRVMAALEAAVKADETPTTKIPVNTPLKSKPAAGSVIFVACSYECVLTGVGMQAAATAAGWSYSQITYDITNPSTLVAALQQALQQKPSAVAVCCLAEALWSSVLPAYQSAGIPIVSYSVADAKIDTTLISNDVGIPQYQAWGKELADWFIVNSKGKGHAYFNTQPGLPQLNAGQVGFTAEVKAKCKACKVTVGSESVADANNGVPVTATIAAIQRDRTINYVFTTNGAFFQGLPAKLQSLGLASRVKIGGLEAIAGNQTDIQNGTEAAYVNYSITIGGWMMMDAILRHSEGMAIAPGDVNDTSQLLVKGGNFTVGNSTDVPSNYASLFQTLWHTGS
jgi:ribose transport system substrate-binding protein